MPPVARIESVPPQGEILALAQVTGYAEPLEDVPWGHPALFAVTARTVDGLQGVLLVWRSTLEIVRTLKLILAGPVRTRVRTYVALGAALQDWAREHGVQAAYDIVPSGSPIGRLLAGSRWERDAEGATVGDRTFEIWTYVIPENGEYGWDARPSP